MLSSGTVAENSPASARGPGLIPGWGDPPEKGTAAHSSVLAWEIPGTEEPCGPQFINGGGIRGESQRVGYNLGTTTSLDTFSFLSSTTARGRRGEDGARQVRGRWAP